MLQSELSEQKRNDVYNAYKESIAKFGDSARFVSKSTLFDEAMRMKAPRFYVTYERAARIISSFRYALTSDSSQSLNSLTDMPSSSAAYSFRESPFSDAREV